MLDPRVSHAISLVGLGIQTALTLLLALLFVVLARSGTERPYFAAWTRAWLALLVGLLALSGAFVATAPPVQEGLRLVYQLGKASYFVELASGAFLFAAAPARRLPRGAVLVPCGLLAAASVPSLGRVEGLLAVQALLAVPLLAWAAWVMATVPAPRRTTPALVAAHTLGAMAVLWGLYLAQDQGPRPPPTELSWRTLLAGFNSYIDLLLQTLLAFAMVLVRAQDAQRELVAAHEALGQAHARLREKSLYDPLTGALDRRAFEEGVGLTLTGGGTVVALDLDGLKPVNDRWGHEAGDALLRHFAEGLKARLRDGDRLYRTGGDEFVVVAPGADRERLAARIGQALEVLGDLPPSGERPAIPVRASWGAASFACPAGLPAALRAADGLMYERKRAAKAGRKVRSGVFAPVPAGS